MHPARERTSFSVPLDHVPIVHHEKTDDEASVTIGLY